MQDDIAVMWGDMCDVGNSWLYYCNPACVCGAFLVPQITNGLEYLHCCGIIYHDLKCDNVLVWRYLFPGPQASNQDDYPLGDDAVLVKLADFNISAVIPTVSIINQLRGTPGFMAPELFNYKYGLYTNKVGNLVEAHSYILNEQQSRFRANVPCTPQLTKTFGLKCPASY